MRVPVDPLANRRAIFGIFTVKCQLSVDPGFGV